MGVDPDGKWNGNLMVGKVPGNDDLGNWKFGAAEDDF